jgi:hypothetical protein
MRSCCSLSRLEQQLADYPGVTGPFVNLNAPRNDIGMKRRQIVLGYPWIKMMRAVKIEVHGREEKPLDHI